MEKIQRNLELVWAVPLRKQRSAQSLIPMKMKKRLVSELFRSCCAENLFVFRRNQRNVAVKPPARKMMLPRSRRLSKRMIPEMIQNLLKRRS